MKHIVLVGVFLSYLLVNSCLQKSNESRAGGDALDQPENTMAVIQFDTLVNELGSISEGEQVVTWFEYQNAGTAPLIIHDIKAGCGCTVPKWNDEPLAPGSSGSIRIVFNSSGKKGSQNIRVTVSSNAKNAKEQLYIRAEVLNSL